MTAIDYFSDTDTVQIATASRGGGEVVTPIWSTVVDGVPYIRSAFGAGSKWYRRAQDTGRAEFVDGSRRFPVTIENTADETILDKVDAAYRAKYSQSPYLPDLLAQQARGLTMRLTPQ